MCTSRLIRVKRTPGIGFMPNMRSTVTWEWPAPTSTTSLTHGMGHALHAAFLAMKGQNVGNAGVVNPALFSIGISARSRG